MFVGVARSMMPRCVVFDVNKTCYYFTNNRSCLFVICFDSGFYFTGIPASTFGENGLALGSGANNRSITPAGSSDAPNAISALLQAFLTTYIAFTSDACGLIACLIIGDDTKNTLNIS